ncbi:type III secretion system stalk subunit SctO [Pseudomonas plecoglossicida]|uniref:Type III secretion protein n=1 Tax=Pseudomonas plecoglossicida TaxID=70775 RepID=A0AAD0QTV2_PSEDL|nr:YscO family type III secretion system apparatus protein [Pseudomonas plecoglossicida]AXM95544.1 hypothetical protein DVB73_06880 [Pseudomonas plecoglossicida]EPB94349.1 translocation protein in type III secretion [Pseudomonas plecoglossicida NB2011]QLB56291.1 YscO family type III secretion system apparatus protein [Pseudomonas plecoglossicida]
MRLNRLLTLKVSRVEQSKRNASLHTSRLHMAQATLAQSRQQHRQYQQWRRDEQYRLFERYKGQVLDGRQLEQWKHANAALREKEARLARTVIEHAQAVTAAQEALFACEQQLKSDQLQVEKFTRLNLLLIAKKHKVFEYREEEELDEFRRPEVPSE